MQVQEDNEKLVFQETRLRSLVKTITYRILSIAGTFLLTWLIIGDIKEVISITLAVQAFLIVLYYSSERVWDRINWGRRIRSM
jgi:uncharacterized membrane protein